MPIPQTFFEFRDARALQGQSWIPLRQVTEAPFEPPEPDIVRLEEWLGIATAAIDDQHRGAAEKLSWTGDLDVDSHHAGLERWGYSAADIFHSGSAALGINLVIDQHIEEEGRHVWHLHPDLIVALDLVREDDSWFRPKEGWAEVVRLKRDASSQPALVEMRAEFLGDYLAARGMALYCSSYRERLALTVTKPTYSWPTDTFDETGNRDKREARILEASYPDPADQFWTRGALWRTEWVEPGTLSTRVRRDPDPHTVTFALKSDGTRVAAGQLAGSMSWLYFAPTVVMALLRHRSATLRWATGETGALGATGRGVQFGVNDLGLITVFAKDIGAMQPWEQRIWSAHNVSPDGGVSRELFAAQMEVNPASTVAPEKELSAVIAALNAAFAARYGAPLLREHESVPGLLRRAHRFLAAEADGLLELSKELTRLFHERIDVDTLVTALALPKSDRKPGSLKALEKVVAKHCSEAEAATMMAPLFGIYDLRLADAHLASGMVASGKARAGVDDNHPAPMQGRQILQSFVDTLRAIAAAIA